MMPEAFLPMAATFLVLSVLAFLAAVVLDALSGYPAHHQGVDALIWAAVPLSCLAVVAGLTHLALEVAS